MVCKLLEVFYGTWTSEVLTASPSAATLCVQAYHAGTVRSYLAGQANTTVKAYNVTVAQITDVRDLPWRSDARPWPHTDTEYAALHIWLATSMPSAQEVNAVACSHPI